jgi:hypothetical protein
MVGEILVHIPLDKFKRRNIVRFLEYNQKIELLCDHTMWNFLDEKHIVSHDALPKKGRADPLTGYIDYIPVTGDFREGYNIFAVVSANPDKAIKRMALLQHLFSL